MKALLNKKISDKILLYSLLYFAISLCCQLIWFPPTLGIIGVMLAWVFSFNFLEKWKKLKNNLLLILLFFLFTAMLLGMLYTENSTRGWEIVTVKISMILFPLALGTSLHIRESRVMLIIKTFAYTVVLASTFLLLRAIWLFLENGETDYFFYQNLVFFDMVSVHYFALYICFSFFILLDDLLKIWKNRNSEFRFFSILCLSLLLSMLFLCSVRAQLLAFLLTGSVFLFWQLGKKVTLDKITLYLSGFILLFCAIVYIIPSSRRKVKETFDEWNYYRGIKNDKQTNHRVYLWKYGSEVIWKNFWSGTGTGDANDILYEKTKYSKAIFWDGYTPYTLAKKKYNYHNAFLQHFAALGIVGFILLLLVFLVPAIYLIKNFQFLPFSFLSLSFIGFLTESMLERQAGNLFFAFMYSLIFISGYFKKQP